VAGLARRSVFVTLGSYPGCKKILHFPIMCSHLLVWLC
jgi:hypothetical protein